MTYNREADAYKVVNVHPDTGALLDASLGEPAGGALLVTPGAGALSGGPYRGVSFAGAGTITFTLYPSGTSIVIPSGALATGIIHPVRFTHVTAATATNIVAWK